MCNMHQRSEIVKRSGLSEELAYATIISLITQAKEMGIKQLFLLGGEPFLREDIFVDQLVFQKIVEISILNY